MKTAIPEEFLHFIWRTRLFDLNDLRTSRGDRIRLIDPGRLNPNAGPDFLNARLYLGDTLWVGNIEIHVRTMDWILHGHFEDPAYRSVILHVVWEDDMPLFLPDGSQLPCLEMQGRVRQEVWTRYRQYQANLDWLACRAHFRETPELVLTGWMDRLSVERLQDQSSRVQAWLDGSRSDWEAVFYTALCRSLGLPVNSDPFEWLAHAVPLGLARKYADRLLCLEALYFGQAGLLAGPFRDEYPNTLVKEYRYLATKHQLTPLPPGIWKFSRLRPASFPTLRIAQLAAMVHFSTHWMGGLAEVGHWQDLSYWFSRPVSEYWQHHYRPDVPSRQPIGSPGQDLIQRIALHAVGPVLFLWGQWKSQTALSESALRLQATLPPEKDKLIEEWKEAGLSGSHAGQTQAMHHWRKKYCQERRCLQCAVGLHLLKSSG